MKHFRFAISSLDELLVSNILFMVIFVAFTENELCINESSSVATGGGGANGGSCPPQPSPGVDLEISANPVRKLVR